MSPAENIISDTIAAEVAIIGSGIAGALVAWKLASLGVRNIVVLEAGPRVERADIVQKFKSSATLDFSAGYPNMPHAPRPDWNNPQRPYIDLEGPVAVKTEYLRVVGGTTWHWAGFAARMLPVDFRQLSAYGVGCDWPFDYAALEPFYTEAEAEMGVAGDDGEDSGSPRSGAYPLPPIPWGYCDRHIAQKLEKSGIRFNTRPAARASRPYRGRGQCQGFGTCSPICPSGAQYGAIYHVEAAEALGVRVIENCRVDKIAAGENVTHIEASRPDGARLSVSAKIYVVAANGIETPRLLLMSAGEGQPRGIANSSGAVGRYYMDHPTVTCALSMPEPVWPGRGPESIVYSNHFRDGAFRKDRPGWALFIGNRVDFYNIADSLLDAGVEPPALAAAIRDRVQRQVQLHASIEQLGEVANGITLDWGKRDTAGQPVMRHYYSLGDYERRGAAHAKRAFGRMARALGATVLSIGEPGPVHHPMGMARMGNDAKTSVTDGFGRCHDHKNLFIAGSALFPAAGCINPTLTIAALALRTAGEIARQLKS